MTKKTPVFHSPLGSPFLKLWQKSFSLNYLSSRDAKKLNSFLSFFLLLRRLLAKKRKRRSTSTMRTFKVQQQRRKGQLGGSNLASKMQFLDFIYLDAILPPAESKGFFFLLDNMAKNPRCLCAFYRRHGELGELVTAFQWKVFLLRFYYHHHVYPELVTKVSKVRKQEIQSSSFCYC